VPRPLHSDALGFPQARKSDSAFCEYQVMPFGLTNAPAAFQNRINDTFCPSLDSLFVVYLDDILVYSQTLQEHEKHVKQVLDVMREAHLFAKAEKCSFDSSSTEYLGFIVNQEGVKMDPSKVDSVRSWPLPRTVKEVQSFFRIPNFYRHFIKDYSKIAHPLTRRTKKDADFSMDAAAVSAFEALKGAFENGSIVHHFRPGIPLELETDASDFALGSVLSQRHEDGKLYPIAFRSRKFDTAELNYQVHDKESSLSSTPTGSSAHTPTTFTPPPKCTPTTPISATSFPPASSTADKRGSMSSCPSSR
jgi:hypothetical protein